MNTITMTNGKTVSVEHYASGLQAYEYLKTNKIDAYYGSVCSWGMTKLDDLPIVTGLCFQKGDIATLNKIKNFISAGGFISQHWVDAPVQKMPDAVTLEEALDSGRVWFNYGNHRKPHDTDRINIYVVYDNGGLGYDEESVGEKTFELECSWDELMAAVEAKHLMK